MWEDDIKRFLKGVMFEAMDWIQLCPARVQCRVLVNDVMNFYIP